MPMGWKTKNRGKLREQVPWAPCLGASKKGRACTRPRCYAGIKRYLKSLNWSTSNCRGVTLWGISFHWEFITRVLNRLLTWL